MKCDLTFWINNTEDVPAENSPKRSTETILHAICKLNLYIGLTYCFQIKLTLCDDMASMHTCCAFLHIHACIACMYTRMLRIHVPMLDLWSGATLLIEQEMRSSPVFSSATEHRNEGLMLHRLMVTMRHRSVRPAAQMGSSWLRTTWIARSP